MKTLIIALLPLLPACASTTNEARDNVAIVWHRVEDPHSACQALAGRKEVFAIRGCSKWSDSERAGIRTCNIYARPPRSEGDTQAFATIGHEVMHCFQGNWHDRWGRMNPPAVKVAALRGEAAAQLDGE